MKTPRKATSSRDQTNAVIVQSDDGAVRFRLQSTPHGLLVQRERRRQDQGAHLVQSVVFSDAAGFSRWAEADSVRFDYPIVFSTVRREAGALLETHGHAKDPRRDHEGR